MKIFVTASILLFLAGCATLQSTPPKQVSELPIIRVGDQPPESSEFIVYFPARHAIPVKLNIEGSLFSTDAQITSSTTLKKDLYLYKSWASHNGKEWKRSHNLIDVNFSGGFDIEGLQSNIILQTQ